MHTIDINMLKESEAELGDKMKIVIQFFFEDLDNYLMLLDNAIKDKNSSEINRIAHIIKSSSKVIAALNLSEIAKDIEKLTETEQFSYNQLSLLIADLAKEGTIAKEEFIQMGFLS